MHDEACSSILNRVAEEGYAVKLGLRVVELRPGYAMVEMVPRADDTNMFGMVHGGALFSLMDEAFQASCNSHGTVAVALNVNVVFHNPAKPDGVLRAESKEIHRSRKTATYGITVRDHRGKRIASSQAIAFRKEERLPFLPASID